jgi:hypothetical protein
MLAFALREHLARGDVESRKQGGGPVSNIVVRNLFDVAQFQREERLRSIQRLDLALLVDAQDHPVVGWVERERTMSRTFSTKTGSVEILKCFWRWGWRPKAFQRRWTVDIDSFVSAAMQRHVQCVPSLGFALRVLRVRVATSSSRIERGPPGRGSS